MLQHDTLKGNGQMKVMCAGLAWKLPIPSGRSWGPMQAT